MLKAIATVVWSLAILFAFYRVASEARRLSDSHYELLEAPPLTGIESRYIDLLTLGARPVYDDVVAIWATQFLVDPNLRNYSTEEVFSTLKQMARHHPKSPGFYTNSCWYMGLVRKQPEYCEPLILEGMAALPGHWQLPALQGFMAGFRMHDYEKATVYFSITASIPGAPEYFVGVTKKIADKGGIDTDMLNETFNVLRDDPNSGVGELVQRLLKEAGEKP